MNYIQYTTAAIYQVLKHLLRAKVVDLQELIILLIKYKIRQQKESYKERKQTGVQQQKFGKIMPNN